MDASSEANARPQYFLMTSRGHAHAKQSHIAIGDTLSKQFPDKVLVSSSME